MALEEKSFAAFTAARYSAAQKIYLDCGFPPFAGSPALVEDFVGCALEEVSAPFMKNGLNSDSPFAGTPLFIMAQMQ